MREAPLKLTERVVRNFMAQESLTVACKEIAETPRNDLEGSVFSISFKCKSLHTKFRTVCSDVVCSREKNAKETYFDKYSTPQYFGIDVLRSLLEQDL